MGWSWYLGDDMIFFIISIIILPIYHRVRWLGWVTVLALTGASIGVTAWLVIRYHLSIYIFDKHYADYSYYAYSKPYTRIPAYFVGLMAAWVLDDLEQRGITRDTIAKTALKRMSAIAGAALAAALLIFITFIPGSDFGENKNSWGSVANVLYIALSRPVWAMCCAAITLLCYYDFLPMVNGFLAHPYWTPLARLTYGAYLVHPLVIKLAAGRALQFYTFNSWDMAYRWSGNTIMAFSGSVLLWCLVERPCMTLFSPARKSQTQQKNDKLKPSKPESLSGYSTTTGASNSNPDVLSEISRTNSNATDFSVEKPSQR